MIDFIRKLVHACSDAELELLHAECFAVKNKRSQERIARGEYAALNEAEIAHCQQGNYIDAIKAYRERNQVYLLEAKTAIDKYRDEHAVVLPPLNADERALCDRRQDNDIIAARDAYQARVNVSRDNATQVISKYIFL